MRLGAKNSVEIDGNCNLALRGGNWGRERRGESNSGGGERMGVVRGGIGEELEISEKSLGPFASGTLHRGVTPTGVVEPSWFKVWKCEK